MDPITEATTDTSDFNARVLDVTVLESYADFLAVDPDNMNKQLEESALTAGFASFDQVREDYALAYMTALAVEYSDQATRVPTLESSLTICKRFQDEVLAGNVLHNRKERFFSSKSMSAYFLGFKFSEIYFYMIAEFLYRVKHMEVKAPSVN